MHILLDIPASEAVKLRSVEINGKLTFKLGADRALNAYKIWVRAGELHIGSALEPFDSKATITLLGNNLEEYWSYTASTETGNKGLVITGKAFMYGINRPVVKGRLRQTAYAT